MEFNTPTTKEQMYTILNDLFYYYRIRRETYEDVELEELFLPRLEQVTINESDLWDQAEVELSGKHEREIQDYKQELNAQILQINEQMEFCTQSALNQVASVEELFAQSVAKIQKQITNSGLINSTIVIEKTAQLEESKNQEIIRINAERDKTLESLRTKRSVAESKLTNSSTYFSLIHKKETDAKCEELKREVQKTQREIFKYNNSLDEKEQRYANTVKETKASLRLRFLDISSGEFTHDQLVEMGYYTDVIRCVSGYYDTLPPVDAFYDIASEKKLAIYLEDYFQDIVYVYKLKANV